MIHLAFLSLKPVDSASVSHCDRDVNAHFHCNLPIYPLCAAASYLLVKGEKDKTKTKPVGSLNSRWSKAAGAAWSFDTKLFLFALGAIVRLFDRHVCLFNIFIMNKNDEHFKFEPLTMQHVSFLRELRFFSTHNLRRQGPHQGNSRFIWLGFSCCKCEM